MGGKTAISATYSRGWLVVHGLTDEHWDRLSSGQPINAPDDGDDEYYRYDEDDDDDLTDGDDHDDSFNSRFGTYPLTLKISSHPHHVH